MEHVFTMEHGSKGDLQCALAVTLMYVEKGITVWLTWTTKMESSLLPGRETGVFEAPRKNSLQRGCRTDLPSRSFGINREREINLSMDSEQFAIRIKFQEKHHLTDCATTIAFCLNIRQVC